MLKKAKVIFFVVFQKLYVHTYFLFTSWYDTLEYKVYKIIKVCFCQGFFRRKQKQNFSLTRQCRVRNMYDQTNPTQIIYIILFFDASNKSSNFITSFSEEISKGIARTIIWEREKKSEIYEFLGTKPCRWRGIIN